MEPTPDMMVEAIWKLRKIPISKRPRGTIAKIPVDKTVHQAGEFWVLILANESWDPTHRMRFCNTEQEAVSWKILHNIS